MNKCPKAYRRNVKAEVKQKLMLFATASLFVLMLLVVFLIDCYR